MMPWPPRMDPIRVKSGLILRRPHGSGLLARARAREPLFALERQYSEKSGEDEATMRKGRQAIMPLYRIV